MEWRHAHNAGWNIRRKCACTELQRWGQQIVAFIEGVARERSGGAPATVRTIAHCGTAGLVAYSMLGAPYLLLPIHPITALSCRALPPRHLGVLQY